jgi:hypothetical protein
VLKIIDATENLKAQNLISDNLLAGRISEALNMKPERR